jgi:tRNA (uracil-5-)-methyltransferase TRM9
MSTDQTNTEEGKDDKAYEQKHVHDVYQQIASHFSSTRYKVSPLPKRKKNL